MNNRLSKKEYWDDNYNHKVFLPVKIDPTSLDLFELDKIFKRYLKVDKNDAFIELGCAPGGWMYYFNNYFNLNVSGVDYSKSGVDLTLENMKLLGIDSNVEEGDIFKYGNKKLFNVVFSAGLIEHFYDDSLDKLLEKHIELVKSGGYVIIMIPNFQGFNYFYQNIINKKNIEIHNLKIMNINFFENCFNENRLEKIFLGYAGKFNFGLYSATNKIFGYLHTMAQIIFNFLFLKLGIKICDSKYTSPYILAIYKKK